MNARRLSRKPELAPARRAAIPLAAAADPVLVAREAGLRHVNDAGPGFRRVGTGDTVSYRDVAGRRLRDGAHLARIRSLAIPPAWTDVWICPRPDGHLQATGRDARGRKQYRYHPRWAQVRDGTKYDRMIAFGKALPRVRARVEAALARPGLDREKVIATIVRLLEVTLIRVGNEEYARQNNSYGLTTLRNHHVKVTGDRVHFGFRGKSGVCHAIDVRDARLARVVRRCRELPGYELFSYLDDDGATRSVDSADVNAWLQEVAGEAFTAKDYRTWAGTVLAAQALCAQGVCASEAEATRAVAAAIVSVAARLGNTPAVCRKCYVHPAVIDAYRGGELVPALCKRLREGDGAPAGADALAVDERAVLAFITARTKA
ncbi:MAG: DNA topoisomerase IB [Myxococcales bacterium]|nr:DNA topoisomerase IB [Myxococcales bacterium]